MPYSPELPAPGRPDGDDPEEAFPTLPLEGWADFETTLRKKSPGEQAASPGEWALVVYAGAQLGRVYPVKAGPQILGRSPSVDITLLDEEVSRQHARLCLELGGGDPEITLEDLASTNGTFVNGRPVAGRVRLRSGDRIALGGHVLKVVAMDPLERQFHETLVDQSTRDPLTGLANRGATLIELQTRFELSDRHNRPLALIMCDLDHFKSINDRYGHAGGDAVLKVFGERVQKQLRGTDMAGRIGGEEFLVILPETDMEGALRLGERLRATLAGEPVRLGELNIEVTCSLGVAQRTSDDRDGGILLARADAALYRAKHEGRNRVVRSS
nr:GGDEF domain-containing protein [uncultured Holophaga sp.]